MYIESIIPGSHSRRAGIADPDVSGRANRKIFIRENVPAVGAQIAASSHVIADVCIIGKPHVEEAVTVKTKRPLAGEGRIEISVYREKDRAAAELCGGRAVFGAGTIKWGKRCPFLQEDVIDIKITGSESGNFQHGEPIFVVRDNPRSIDRHGNPSPLFGAVEGNGLHRAILIAVFVPESKLQGTGGRIDGLNVHRKGVRPAGNRLGFRLRKAQRPCNPAFELQAIDAGTDGLNRAHRVVCGRVVLISPHPRFAVGIHFK